MTGGDPARDSRLTTANKGVRGGCYLPGGSGSVLPEYCPPVRVPPNQQPRS